MPDRRCSYTRVGSFATGIMAVESEDGLRPSMAEQIQANMERSALRREVLRRSRAEKRRQSIPRMEMCQDSGEEVCIHSCVCVQLLSNYSQTVVRSRPLRPD